jgi:hypothetical protein
VGNSGNELKVHELLPKPNEGCKIERLREQIAEVRSGVHVNCLDKIGITEGLYPLLSGTSRTRFLLDAARNRGAERKKKMEPPFGPDVGRPTSVWDYPG